MVLLLILTHQERLLANYFDILCLCVGGGGGRLGIGGRRERLGIGGKEGFKVPLVFHFSIN